MSVVLSRLGRVDYETTWRAMRQFTAGRTATTPDELWLVEHPPVYTLGLAGRREHVHATGAIPVVATDRGGQVTYHGPGQAIVYALLDLRRSRMSVRQLVHELEQAVIDAVATGNVVAQRRAGAPGVYVGERKLAALGLRIRNGCSYHGVALNVTLDLGPFAGIDPCGYRGLEVTNLAALGVQGDVWLWAERVAARLAAAVDGRREGALESA